MHTVPHAGPSTGPDAGQQPGQDPRARYRTLPDPVRAEDMVEGVAATPAPDPTHGRDPDTWFLLRNAG